MDRHKGRIIEIDIKKSGLSRIRPVIPFKKYHGLLYLLKSEDLSRF